MSENNFHDGDIVTYPIHENTKHQRLKFFYKRLSLF